MNKAIKKKWIDALRSGQYRQTRDKLKSRNGGFCCLGVLCDIQDATWRWKEGDLYFVGQEAFLPPEKYRHDLSHETICNLAYRNDGEEGYHKHSFSEIANYIEDNL